MQNADEKTVQHFGEEWSTYDQTGLSDEDAQKHFDAYFHVFPWDRIDDTKRGFDMGCGSGRWARLFAPKVGALVCVDAAEPALNVAKSVLAEAGNCEFIHASVAETPIEEGSMDFGYSLGVLHHVPDTAGAIAKCASFLKPGAPLLLYLYYRFDNRPLWFRLVWQFSNIFRRVICILPRPLKHAVCWMIAATVYWPLARFGKLLEKIGLPFENLPLWAYRHFEFYTMRTDALDRFGTPLEQRFTRKEITEMLEAADMENPEFSDEIPFWCVVAYRKETA